MSRSAALFVATIGTLLVSAAALLVPTTAASQVFQPERERESTERSSEVGREAARGAAEAERFDAKDTGLTYADVLAAPDDVELNYRWANQQVADGDLKGAAATLERILLLQPDLVPVRVFHAIVLYRLDDLAGAEAELERVRGAQLDATLAATVDEYRRRIDRRQRRTRGAFSISGGAQYDSNRNSAPKSDSLLIRDFRFQLGDGVTEDDDYAYLAITDVGFQHDLGSQEQHTLFGRLSYYNAEQENQEIFDVRSASAEMGLLYRTQPIDWTFSLSGGLVDLSSEKFVRSLAGEIRAQRRLGPRSLGRALTRLEYFDYDGIPNSFRAYERTGFETTAGFEVETTWTPAHRTLASLGGRNRSADVRYYSHIGPTGGIQHTWLPGGGQFVIGSVTLDWNRYKDAQTFISTKIRREIEIRSRVLYGAPLSFLSAGLLGGGVGDIVLSLNAEYLWVSSNIPNFTYDNLKVGFLFTKRWDF